MEWNKVSDIKDYFGTVMKVGDYFMYPSVQNGTYRSLNLELRQVVRIDGEKLFVIRYGNPTVSRIQRYDRAVVAPKGYCPPKIKEIEYG